MQNLKTGKKSQSGLLILIGLVTVFIVIWVINMFTTASQQKRIIEILKLSKLSKYLDFFKGFSRESLLLAAHKGTQNVAEHGGEWNEEGESRYWICNSDVSPDIETVRFFLSEATQEYFNRYIINLKDDELTSLDITNATCVDYDVDDDSVMSGQNDERFNVGAYGSEINISYKNDSVYSENDIYEEIAQDRFWYMYRNFKVWSQTTSFPGCICGCLASGCCCPPGDCLTDVCPQFKACVEKCFQKAKSELDSKFDEYVKCSYVFDCCYIETQVCGDVQSPCEPWKEAPKCNNCFKTEPDVLCSKTLSFLGDHVEKNYYTLKLEGDCKGVCISWDEVRAAIEGGFYCRDKKYLLSTEDDRKLIFAVNVMMNIKGKQCEKKVECVEKDEGCVCDGNPTCGVWCYQDCTTGDYESEGDIAFCPDDAWIRTGCDPCDWRCATQLCTDVCESSKNIKRKRYYVCDQECTPGPGPTYPPEPPPGPTTTVEPPPTTSPWV